MDFAMLSRRVEPSLLKHPRRETFGGDFARDLSTTPDSVFLARGPVLAVHAVSRV